eukprot:143096_1
MAKKYELYVDNKTFNPGITVALKLKPIFKSPNIQRYIDCEGKWSRTQTFGIPEQEDDYDNVNGSDKISIQTHHVVTEIKKHNIDKYMSNKTAVTYESEDDTTLF